jgi:hypothetical protein
MSHFIQPVLETEALTEAMRLKVKEWPLKKIATQFQTFKKRLYQREKSSIIHWTTREATGSLGRVCEVQGIERKLRKGRKE